MMNEQVRKRLDQEELMWMTTVRSDGQPQTSLVWFLLEDEEILVYSKKDTIRQDNIVANPKVSMNLNSDSKGGSVVSIEGTARLEPDGPRASQNPPYLGKYLKRIEGNGWTPDTFSSDYPDPIRISIDRVRSW